MEKYVQLIDSDFRQKIREMFGEDSGTYTLHWFERGKPKKICRLLDTDPYGILYIGKTDQALHVRAGKQLKDAITNNSDSEQKVPAVVGYNSLSQKFYRTRLRIKTEDLFLNLSNQYDESPLAQESYLIEKYVSKFGELPPFNGQYGSHVHWELFQ